jgi:hypothetical protein
VKLGEVARLTNVQLRHCWRKARWPSKGAAEAQMRSLRRRDGYVRDAERLNVYHCVYCQGWHVGRNWRLP